MTGYRLSVVRAPGAGGPEVRWPGRWQGRLAWEEGGEVRLHLIPCDRNPQRVERQVHRLLAGRGVTGEVELILIPMNPRSPLALD